VVTAVNKAGVHVDDTVYEALACADSVLRTDERELGVCLADIGAGSTNVIVMQEGAVAHSAVIPIGGDHFTSDLSVGLCTPLVEAEKIKKLYGNSIATLIPEGNEVEVPSVGDRPSRMISQRLVGDILEPRARELFEMLRDNLRHAGMLEICMGGIVLSGGASRLPGIVEIAESVLRRLVRMSWPTPLAKMPSTLAEPEFATVLTTEANADAIVSDLQQRVLARVREDLLKRHFEAVGTSFIEMGVGWFAPLDALVARVAVHGREHLERALAAGKGALLFCAVSTMRTICARAVSAPTLVALNLNEPA